MEIVLDGRGWRTEADFIEAVIAGVDGPSWHGRNYNALRDSFVTGSINGIEPPYDFIIQAPSAPTATATSRRSASPSTSAASWSSTATCCTATPTAS